MKKQRKLLKFLEGIITESIDELFEKIKKGEYDFLGTYLDFSNIKELIYQLEREGLKKEDNKAR